MTKQLKKYLKIQDIKYKVDGKYVSKADMKETFDFCFKNSTAINLNIDWDNIHNESHPIEDRLYIIQFINDLLRDHNYHACIIGEVINTQILSKENSHG